MINMATGIIKEIKGIKQEDYGNDFEWDNVWTKKQNTSTLIESPLKTHSRTIFPLPMQKQNELLEYLYGMVKKAQHFICLSSYMLQKSSLTESLLEASSRGVRVYILTAGEQELAKADQEMDDVGKARLEEYKDLLNSMAGKALIRTGSHFHAKFLLIDPNSTNSQGIMMTCNATVDAMTGKNLEAATTLNKNEINSFFSQFINAFWKEAEHELLKPNTLNEVIKKVPADIDFGLVTLPATFANCQSLKEEILRRINTAEKSITLTGWSFSSTHPVLESLEKALSRGISVKILARVSYGNTESLAKLISKGAKLYGHDRLHGKLIIIDSKAVVMTSNFTERGLDSGFETSVVFEEDENKIIEDLAAYFESLCDWSLLSKVKLKDASEKIKKNAANTRIMEEIEIKDVYNRDMGPRPIDLSNPVSKPIDFKNLNPNNPANKKLYKKAYFTWRDVPPTLPSKSTLVQTAKEPFPIFDSAGQKFVVISQWEEVEKAKPLAAKWRAKMVIK